MTGPNALPGGQEAGGQEAGDQVLGADDIARLLPHRYPFLLLDRVTALEPGQRAEAIKNITASDAVLTGHFPGRMVYPGVLLVECVAQLAAVIHGTGVLQEAGEQLDLADRVGYLAEIKQAKFRKAVVPGDQVRFKVHSGPRMGRLISVSGQASVERDVVLTARLVVTDRPEGDDND